MRRACVQTVMVMRSNMIKVIAGEKEKRTNRDRSSSERGTGDDYTLIQQLKQSLPRVIVKVRALITLSLSPQSTRLSHAWSHAWSHACARMGGVGLAMRRRASRRSTARS